MGTSVDRSETILGIIELAGGKLQGRTTLQKLAYFAAVEGICDFKFRAHYYGPYSDEVAQTTSLLSALEALHEDVVITGSQTDLWLREVSGDVRTYTYSLTDQGREIVNNIHKEYPEQWVRLQQLVSTCQKETNLSPGVLATAAKVHFIYTHGPDAPGSNTSVEKAAAGFGWQLSEEDVTKVRHLLERIGIDVGVQVKPAATPA
jgi:uncharacterized protein YwgA